MAIPLSQVSRLEEFPHELIECIGNYDVIQYRHQIMHLIYLAALFSNGDTSSSSFTGALEQQLKTEKNNMLLVVVSNDEEKPTGLVVEQILDIVEQTITIKGAATQTGILYCAVIQERVTEILDVEAIISENSVNKQPELAMANI